MAKRILVPIDFGNQSLIALEYAKFYAKLTGASLDLLTVVEESGILKRLFSPELQEKLINQAQIALKGLAKEKLENFDYKLHIKAGKPYEQIEHLARQIKPLFIVMGKTEQITLTKRIIGSNTLHVIQECDYPVISVRGKQLPGQLKHTIFLPLDLSKPVTEQVNAAIEYAKQLKSDIFVLSIDISDNVAYETNLLITLNKVEKTITQAGIQCKTKIEEGEKQKIVDIINKYAEELKPLLTLIMLRAESSFDESYLGSNAKKLLETSQYPILSLKPWNPRTKTHPIIKLIYDPMNIL